jgi:hypothetical protein
MGNVRNLVLALAGAPLAAGLLLGPAPAWAAFPAQTLEGVSSTRKIPQIHVGARFDQDYTKLSITREFVQDANTDRAEFDEVRELDYEEVRRRLVVEARVGLVSHLELRVNMPFVLQWDSSIGFADEVEGVSTVCCSGDGNADDPQFNNRFPITDVPQERNRSGVGDLELGLAYSPIVDGPDTAWPTITLAAMITVPTGDRWDPADIKALPSVDGTGGVGGGQTVFDFSVALSKRTAPGAPTFDPYFIMGARIPIANGAQKDIGLDPPISGRAELGSEIVIAENEAKQTYYGADFGIRLRYIGEGRTFSPLTDYLPDFDITRVDRDVVLYEDYDDPNNYSRSADGVSCVSNDDGTPRLPGVPCGEFTRVDDHMELDGHIGFRLQPSRWFMFRTGVALGFANDHLITGEAAGEDTDPPSAEGQMCGSVPCLGRINRVNSQGEDERSPFFDPRYDAPGGRFSATDILNVRFFATATATF